MAGNRDSRMAGNLFLRQAAGLSRNAPPVSQDEPVWAVSRDELGVQRVARSRAGPAGV